MKQNLFQDASNAKILALKQQAPKPKQGCDFDDRNLTLLLIEDARYQSELTVLYSQNKENSVRQQAKVMRYIPQTPDRILDAPEMRPDFYLNLVSQFSKLLTILIY